MRDDEGGPTILPLDRAAANRRRTTWLMVVFALIAFPSVAYVGQYLAFVFLLWMVPLFGGAGWVAFFGLDFLLVLALMAVAFRWLYASATRRILRFVGAQRLRENDEREFARMAENMSIACGLPLPALFIIEESAPNLLTVGLSPGDSAMIATRGLLIALDPRELEGVVAHAYAEIGNGDTRLDTLTAAGLSFLKIPGRFVAWACRGLSRLAAQFGVVGWGCLVALGAWLLVPLAFSVVWGLTDPDFWWICWIALAFLVYVFVLGPLLGGLVVQSLVRGRKSLADAKAVQTTRFPVGLARALAKVDAAGSAYPGAPNEAANLYFADPIPGGSGWWARLTDSHPTAAERIQTVSRLGGRVPPAEIIEAAREGAEFAARESNQVTATVARAAEPTVPATPARLSVVRLLEDVPLLTTPRAGSESRSTVRSGTHVTVLSDSEQFIEVVTPDDRIGWVSKLARSEDLGPAAPTMGKPTD